MLAGFQKKAISKQQTICWQERTGSIGRPFVKSPNAIADSLDAERET